VCINQQNQAAANKSCTGCDGIPNPAKPAFYDKCGDCINQAEFQAGLANKACTGCDGVANPAFVAFYDACGRCYTLTDFLNGIKANTTCLDCLGRIIPLLPPGVSPAVYDVCGV